MILPDVLASDLKVVFCGTAAGDTSAAMEAYYAGPGNKFYSILHRTGLTSAMLHPSEYRKLLTYYIGLTDVAKQISGNDSVLRNSDFDIRGFTVKIIKYSPKLLCFNGKAAAAAFLFNNHKKTKYVDFGLLPQKIRNTQLFVAPSTSGSANGIWDESIWFTLAKIIKGV
jgi:TDG/mug DNA glycosylase family protein